MRSALVADLFVARVLDRWCPQIPGRLVLRSNHVLEGSVVQSEWAGSGIAGLSTAVRGVEKSLARRVAEPVLRVFSVDPGKVTGVSVFWYTQQQGRWDPIAWTETLLAGDENGQVLALADVAAFFRGRGPVDFVIEDFRVLKISMERTFLSPVRIGQKFEWELLRSQPEFHHPHAVQFVYSSEMPSMADARLKKLGFYTPGPDHRRDATRHNLLHSRALNNGSEKRNTVEENVLKGFLGGQPFNKSPSVRRSSAVQKPVQKSSAGLRKKKVRRRAI